MDLLRGKILQLELELKNHQRCSVTVNNSGGNGNREHRKSPFNNTRSPRHSANYTPPEDISNDNSLRSEIASDISTDNDNSSITITSTTLSNSRISGSPPITVTISGPNEKVSNIKKS